MKSLERLATAGLLAVLTAAAGCGESTPFPVQEVSGTVRFEDGQPLGVGQVLFTPQVEKKGKAYPKTGIAHLDADGAFDRTTSYEAGDGLIRGRHKVWFQYATDDQGVPLVPEEYTSSSTTPLTIDTADAPLEIVVPRA